MPRRSQIDARRVLTDSRLNRRGPVYDGPELDLELSAAYLCHRVQGPNRIPVLRLA